MDIRGAVDAAVPTNIIAAKAAEVRANKVNWQSYLQGQMISAEDCEFIQRFEMKRSPEEKQEMLQTEGSQCAKTFINLMTHISKEQTVQYILTMVDDMLQENHQRVSIFFDYARRSKNTAWPYFLPMLNRQDPFTVHMAARIIAKLAAWGKELMEGSDLNYYFNWIKTQLSSQCPSSTHVFFDSSQRSFFSDGCHPEEWISSSQYVQCVAGCLQLMLRVNEYRFAWVEADGVNWFSECKRITQLSVACYIPLTILSAMLRVLVVFLVALLQQALLFLRSCDFWSGAVLEMPSNFLEKSTERETRQEYALAMIQCKVLKQLENLEQQKYDDEDISEDIKFLLEKLGESVQDLSSFDEYSSELKSGRLEWSPVHKSEKFWRENAVRLNEKNYELLKILTKLLEVSDDPQVLAVAAHDVGEYVRHYPRGKRVIEQLGGKQLVMNHMHHEDQQVRYNALLAVQKLMVHNWQEKALKQEWASLMKAVCGNMILIVALGVVLLRAPSGQRPGVLGFRPLGRDGKGNCEKTVLVRFGLLLNSLRSIPSTKKVHEWNRHGTVQTRDGTDTGRYRHGTVQTRGGTDTGRYRRGDGTDAGTVQTRGRYRHRDGVHFT
ncbi:V-type proton ATPase subunit H [Tupaia chinensis]|uniref:V-type proton ATPase subunit H n=1 Tax=Tupaia chinensis TaxID=246437 RepID=L9LE40_TUPCH|nr:V-type proton ATPase subunit H [Tupaia chinensis]